MTAAIFGLLGVIVGGVINGVVSAWLGKRQERADGKAAARLVHLEARTHVLVLDAIVKQGTFDVIPTPPPAASEWEAHRAVLARVLANDDWTAVARAYTSIYRLAHIYRSDFNRTATVGAEARDAVIAMRDEGLEALRVLGATARGISKDAIVDEYLLDPDPPAASHPEPSGP